MFKQIVKVGDKYAVRSYTLFIGWEYWDGKEQWWGKPFTFWAMYFETAEDAQKRWETHRPKHSWQLLKSETSQYHNDDVEFVKGLK